MTTTATLERPARRTSLSSPPRRYRARVSANWRKLLALIPGYDCYRDAAGFAFDETRANHVVAFFETQLHIVEGEGAGRLFMLMPWQKALLGCLFGWVDPNGLRRYRECILYIPRKNGKSALCGGLLDYMLICEGEPAAQCLVAAADIPQAAIDYRFAAGMIEANPELAACCTLYRTSRTIQFGEGAAASVARVLSSDSTTKHGFNPSLALLEELHCHASRDLADAMVTGTSSRRQPLVVYVTTADYVRPSICNEVHDRAQQVRDGTIRDPRFLPMIFEAPQEADWREEKVWRACNPSIGVTKKLDYLQRECEKAQATPSYQATFRRLDLNQQTEVAQVWISKPDWDKCAGTAAESDLLGSPCWGGLDLANTKDVAALALCWPIKDRFALRWWFWIPEDTAREKEKVDRVPYLAWHRAGLVDVTPGNVIDYEYIRKKINELAKRFKLQDVGADPWNATQLLTQLIEQDGLKVFQFRQGFVSMSSPAKEFEKLTLAGKLLHGGNPVAAWMIGNTVIRADPAGNIKPDKEHSPQKIDGVVAGVMALGRALAGGASGYSGGYEEHGLRVV